MADKALKLSQAPIIKGAAVDAAATDAASKYQPLETGKGLSANDFTDALKTKLEGTAAGAEVNVLEGVKVNGTALSATDKVVDVTVPTKVSDLTNDSDFASKSEVDTKISTALTSALTYKGVKATVAELPASDAKVGDMYHVTADGGEYIWDGSEWQEAGSIIDLTPYATLAGATFTGAVSGIAPTADANLATKKYVDDTAANAVAAVVEFATDAEVRTELGITA